MYRCETCFTLYRTLEAFGDACPVDGSDRRSLRRLWVQLRCGDDLFRVADFPFSADRAWAKNHFGAVMDGVVNPAYRYFPTDGDLFRLEEDDGGLSIVPCTPQYANHVRIGDRPVSPRGSLLRSESVLHVYSVRRAAIVMSLEVHFETFGTEL